jgi:hypothetical protein
MNENAMLVDVHQRKFLDPPQVLVGYARQVDFVADISSI